MPRTKPSIATLLKELARTTSEALSLDSIVSFVQSRRGPSRTNLHRRIQTMLSTQAVQLGWMTVSPMQYVPIRLAVRGICFRVIPDASAIAVSNLNERGLGICKGNVLLGQNFLM